MTSLTASCSGVTAGFHAEMVPFNVAKINEAGAGVLPGTLVIIKSVVPLKTIPVGAEAPFAPGALGTVTGDGGATIVPVPVYRVEVPVPALFTHQGLEALRARPQAFLRFGSWTATACPLTFARSETRLVCV
jgi:hypothetical protein